jgi:2-iminobutanoate/2-iminopropanoate deaminase
VSIEPVSTDAAPRPAGSYNQAIVADGFLWTAGFGPQDPATGEVPDGIEEQTRQVIENVRATLSVRGLDLGDVVKVTTHLQHLRRDFAAYDEVYSERFVEPYPARTTVGSDLLDILVEIDVVARLRP